MEGPSPYGTFIGLIILSLLIAFVLRSIAKRRGKTPVIKKETIDPAEKYKKITVETRNGKTIEQLLASRGQRLGAALIDIFLVFVPSFILGREFSLLTMENGEPHNFTMMIMGEPRNFTLTLIGEAVFLALNGYLLWKRGQTLGKKIVGTRIVNLSGATPSFMILYLVRYLLIHLICLIPLIGIFFALLDPLFIFRKDLRCIHDHIAGTRVILV